MNHDFAKELRGPDAPPWRDALERFVICVMLALLAAAAGTLIGLSLHFGGVLTL